MPQKRAQRRERPRVGSETSGFAQVVGGREAGLHLPRWCSGPPARCRAPWDLPEAAPRDTSPLEVKRRYQGLGREPRLARPGPGTRINRLRRDRSPEKQLWAQDAPKPQMSALQTRYRTQPGV